MTASQETGDTVAFKYATQLSVVKYEGYTVVSLKNPWKPGKTLHEYILVPDSIDPQDISLDSHHSPLTSTIVRTPLKRAVMFTTVHCAMLMEFGKQDCISGVADLKYIKIPWVQEQVKCGKMTDVGEGMSPVIEKIIDEHVVCEDINNNEIVNSEVYKDSVDVAFEGALYKAPIGYQAYLKAMYGDYMTLPPVEERVPFIVLMRFIYSFFATIIPNLYAYS